MSNAPQHARLQQFLADLDFDLDALRRKYHAERDKRIRPQRDGQWTEVSGDFAHYLDDPSRETPAPRDTVCEDVEVVIVGGGFGGLIAGTLLRKAGVESIRIIDRAADFGGTWYWNRYPGAQCDIESYIYMPLLEETGYIPTQKYAYGPELFEHARRIGRTANLYKAALFETQITAMTWLEDSRRWRVTTDRGDVLSARFVISASGPLNRPKLPGIPGIRDFEGAMFHTSRWDYGYTGGDETGGMSRLADKRVAVIGTGATGIQCIPYLARDAGHLYVFQRTPSTVDVRGNRPTDEEWVNNLQPGWQAERIKNFNLMVSGGSVDEDLVKDGWTDTYNELQSLQDLDDGSIDAGTMAHLAELVDFRKGHQVRKRIDDVVKDPATAERLKAWFPMFCKRPTYNDEYLPAFNRQNVTLVDTQGLGVERFTSHSVVANGIEYAVDCVIFATGFETGTNYTRRAGFELYGRGGQALSEYFADGPKSLHGFLSHGFPNFFMLGLGQNAFKINITDMLTEQAEHIVRLIDVVRTRGLSTIEASRDAEAQWGRIIREKSQNLRDFYSQCTPGYYNGEGNVDKGIFIESYGGGSIEFTRLLQDWWAGNTLEGLELG